MIRAFVTGLRVHLVHLLRSPFDLVAILIWPVIFASIAYYLIGTDGSTRVLFVASLGAAMMMLWSQVIVGSGFSLDQQRNQGTLELLVAAPVPLVIVIAPVMIASAAFGIYGLLVTLAWGRFAFGIPIAIDHPAAFVAAAVAAIVSIGLLGLIAASLFVLSRAASYFGVALQYPVYLASGLMLPLALLPAWIAPLSWVLAPTWGYRALTHASGGGSAWREIGMCLLLSAVYLVLALPCLAWFERVARDRVDPEALVNWLRVFFHGGLTSYRALFAWINPWIFLPVLVAYPVFQTVFFVYLGRAANVADDTFFVIGNSFVAAAVTGLFGMGQAIAGERRFQTLPVLLASPASRLALFLGRAVPTIVNGFVVATITFVLGGALMGVTIDRAAYGGLALALAASCFACTALGLCVGSLTFRARSISVFADAISAALLLVTGANVPLERLPDVLQRLSDYIPLTHGLHAARALATGAPVTDVLPQVRDELLVGAAYFAAGLLLLRYFERDGRRAGSFERF